MGNAFAKSVGLVLLVLGLVALFGGLGVAGYAALDEKDNQDSLLADGRRSDQNADLVVYGLGGAGVGFLAVIVGAIMVAASGSDTVVVANGGSPAPIAPAPVPKRKGTVLAATLGVVALVSTAILAVGLGSGNWQTAALLGSADPSGEHRQAGLLESKDFTGRVRYAASDPTQSTTADNSESEVEFDLPENTTRVTLNLTWTTTMGGADDLRMLLELEDAGAWIELGRAGGPGPVALTVSDGRLSKAHVRFAVFPNADVSLVVEQAFKVTVEAFRE